MLSYIFKKFFVKEDKIIEKPLTIINENREIGISRRDALYNKKIERQTTCLSKYFSKIKGLNTLERKIYSKIV